MILENIDSVYLWHDAPTCKNKCGTEKTYICHKIGNERVKVWLHSLFLPLSVVLGTPVTPISGSGSGVVVLKGPNHNWAKFVYYFFLPQTL